MIEFVKPTNNDTTAAQPTPDNWAHRSQGMVCGTCMYFVPKRVDTEHGAKNGPLGRCRRRAPTLNGWPAIFALDWCGDHKLDETKIGA